MIDTFEAGATGTGEGVGAGLFTQHGLSQAQRWQHDCAFAGGSALTGSTQGVTASNKLNNMAIVAFK